MRSSRWQVTTELIKQPSEDQQLLANNTLRPDYSRPCLGNDHEEIWISRVGLLLDPRILNGRPEEALWTWGVPPLEPQTEQSFRMIYFLRLVLGNVLGLTLGAFLAAAATNLGLRMAGKATYIRGALGGAILGAAVGAVTAGSCPFLLLISSTDPNWAWIMIERSFLVGGLMGLINGLFAGLVIVYFIKRQPSG